MYYYSTVIAEYCTVMIRTLILYKVAVIMTYREQCLVLFSDERAVNSYRQPTHLYALLLAA